MPKLVEQIGALLPINKTYPSFEEIIKMRTKLQPLSELQELSFRISTPRLTIGRVKDLSTLNLDFEVYLSSLDLLLQRELVWTLQQKQELILSILYKKEIPPVAIATLKDDESETKYVIDGKQRLSTYLEFSRNEFSIELEGQSFFFSDLKENEPEYFKTINLFYIETAMAYELTEKQMAEWFLRLNFSSTPQEESHKDYVLQKLNGV